MRLLACNSIEVNEIKDSVIAVVNRLRSPQFSNACSWFLLFVEISLGDFSIIT